MPESLGLQIKIARVRKGLSQWQLAQALNVSEVTLSRWETDRYSPSPELLRKLERILETRFIFPGKEV